MRALQVFLAAAVTLTSAACGSVPRFQPIDVRDVKLVPNVRVGKNLYATEQTQIVAEAGATWVKGSSSSPLTSQARIGDTNFDPPGTLLTDVDLDVFDASFRWRHVLNSAPVGFELSAGFAYLDLDVAMTSFTSTARIAGAESVSSPAGRFSIGAIWRMSPTMDLAATATAFGTSRSVLTNADAWDVMLERRFKERFVIRGGYANWQADSVSSTRSSVSFRSQGPSVGFAAQF
jgi:hypothetical protein